VKRSFIHNFFVFALCFFWTTSFAHAQSPFTRNALIAESCRLTEEQRYADGALMAERLKLVCPHDPAALVTVGSVALQVGAVGNAASAFNTALTVDPSNPLALYGKSLVDLLRGQTQTALVTINSIDTTVLSTAAQTDITLVKSLCLSQTDNPDEALSLLAGVTDPVADELTALIKFRTDPSNSQPLTTDLESAMTDGVPVVVEPPGLRLLAPASHVGPSIEPSIVDSETQTDMAKRFDSSALAPGLSVVTGDISAAPPRAIPLGVYSVSLAVDGDIIGDSNEPPYVFSWDTRSVPNGQHSLTFNLLGLNGNEMAVQDDDVWVLNTDPSPTDNNGPLTPELEERLWNLLRICPDYKVPEYELALSALNAHDQADYETHILRAAALDPDYRDVRSRIAPLFAGQVPVRFPVPDGTTLPSSLGLSAGSASSAGFWAGNPHIREIALTFDDGPIPGPTKDLLDALRGVNARATFFVVGMRAAQSPSSLRQMAADGDDVEDHSFTHPNLTQILPQHIMLEILRTAVVIEATTGHWPHFLRPPGGNTDPDVLDTARTCGMSGAFWTIDALPAEESGSSIAVASWVISRARPGAIVLMHNGMAATVGAVPALVQGLRNRGYKLVTIRQLAVDALGNSY